MTYTSGIIYKYTLHANARHLYDMITATSSVLQSTKICICDSTKFPLFEEKIGPDRQFFEQLEI